MINGVNDFQKVFFIGVAGTGMSALAQYLSGIGKQVSGSDRYFSPDVFNETQQKLEEAGIQCFIQDGSGMDENTHLVVVSTAVEDAVYEVQLAKKFGIPIIRRSELLALICKSKTTMAVGGTSGKSTTSAMLFDMLQYAGMKPSIISGAGLVSIIREGKIGNAKVGEGEWLVIEADESDGSIVQYQPNVGLLLNVDKDHQEIEVLMDLFGQFKNNTTDIFIVNQDNVFSKKISRNLNVDFSSDKNSGAGFIAVNFQQHGLNIEFEVNQVLFSMKVLGKHNMENALAAIAVANSLGVSLQTCSMALSNYEGIYRRHQILGDKNGVMLIDDYAHNPAKCAASIAACQPIAPKVIAWFQPHGYGPTRFLRNDFVNEIAKVLRAEDEIWMSEIFYAGGTAVKDISSNDLIKDIAAMGKNAFFVEDRNELVSAVRSHFTERCVLLLMGARDPSLESFANNVLEQL
jgi:UDP-N-acetylmuramate--alanine ligase